MPANSGTVLYAIVGGIGIGIGASLYGLSGFMVALIIFGAAALFILIGVITRRKYLLFFAILCASFALGLIRADYSTARFSSQNILSFVSNHLATVEGKIVADPDRRDDATHVEVVVSKINNTPAYGEVVVYLPPDQPLSYNDAVTLSGILEAPQSFQGDAGNEFDYPHYLQVKNISAVLNKAKVELVRNGGWSIFGTLYAVRQKFDASIAQLFAAPEASLLQGMLFGERRGLPKDLQKILVTVGLIHIVILAGYALTLVARAVGNSANLLPKKYQLPVVAIVLIMYVALTGAAASTTRAAIMAQIGMVARMAGRTSVALRSLAVAIMAMALWNPPMLLWDSGFIVSVLATFGLITLGGSLEKLLHFIPTRLAFREIATSTLAVQIFALPALLYYSGNFSLVSIPANLLALPALPYAMLFGFLSAALNFIHPAIAFIPSLITYALVHYILFIATTAASIPYGSSVLYAFPWWGTILIYIPLTLLAIHEYVHQKERPRST